MIESYGGYTARAIVSSLNWYNLYGMGIIKNNKSMMIPPSSVMNITLKDGDRYYQLNPEIFIRLVGEVYKILMKFYIMGSIPIVELFKFDHNWATTSSLIHKLWLSGMIERIMPYHLRLTKEGIDFIHNYDIMVEQIKNHEVNK